VPGTVLAAVAAVSFLVTAALPNAGVRSGLIRAAGLTSFLGAVVAAGGFLSGGQQGQLVGFVAAGAFFAVIAPANVVAGPLLPAEVRASAFSVMMGVLVAFQSAGASVAGALADRMHTPYAAALVCLPAAAGGLWVLLARPPAGLDADIEAPLDLRPAVPAEPAMALAGAVARARGSHRAPRPQQTSEPRGRGRVRAGPRAGEYSERI
jgi:hypothetical protein